jgi:hypothetical protein
MLVQQWSFGQEFRWRKWWNSLHFGYGKEGKKTVKEFMIGQKRAKT